MTAPGFHRGLPYGLALIPFLVLSFCAHSATLGGYVWFEQAGGKGDKDFEVKRFGVPKAAGSIADQMKGLQLQAGKRPRNYRMLYEPKVILPRKVEPLALAAIPEPPPPAVVKKPSKPLPKPAPKPALKPAPSPSDGGAGMTPPDPTSVATGDLKGADGEVLAIPPFRLHCLVDDVDRIESDFLNYPAIYVVGDISTEDGLTTLYHWIHYFHDVLHLPNVKSPPYVLAIGVAKEKPDFLPIDLAEDAMKNRWETMGFFPGSVWGDVAFDPEARFLEGLDVKEIPAPQIYVADLSGYIRIRIQGKLAELSPEEIKQIMDEIKIAWGMNNMEYGMAKTMTTSWQQALQQDKLNQPTVVDPEAVPLAIPPFQTEE